MSGKRAQGLRLKALEGTVLGPIAEAALRRAESLPAVTDETVAAAMAAPRGASGLREALSRPGRRFILEVKAASPSLGVIRSDIDLEACARAYARHADAVSLAVRRLVFGEMKVCGITRADDAARAALEGFSAAGVVLAKRSPKAVTPEALVVLSNEIKERTKALGLTMPVTAVVDAGETDVLRAIASPAAAGAFTTLQVHGDVTDADLEGLRVLFPGKALHLAAALPEDPVELAEAARRLEGLLERGLADRIVVDGTSGGSGRTVPQARLAAFGDLSRIRLAGGLTPENARAAAAAGAAGLDANSGVESAPGLKDPRLLALFAGAVRG